MPVVNREIERNIVRSAVDRGFSQEQIKQAVQAYREQSGQAGQSVSRETSKSSSVFGSTPEQVAIGAGKGVLSTVKGASGLGERIIQGLGRLVTPKALEERLGFAKQDQTSAEQLQTKAETALGAKPGSLTTPEGAAQKFGFGAEQIGEFLIPGSAGLKVGRAAEAAVGGSKLARGLTRLGATAGAEAGLSAGQTAIQQGEVNKEVGTAAAFGAATPVAGAVLGRVIKGLGSAGAEALGRTTGAGKASIVEAFNNPNVVKFAREAGSNAEDLLIRTAEDTKAALSQVYKDRGNLYRQQLKELNLSQDLKGVLADTRTALKGLSDDLDTVVEGRNVVDRAIKDVRGWKKTSAEGMDALKQRLESYAQQLNAPGKSRAKRIVNELKSVVRSGLDSNVEGYQKMTSAYNQTSNLINDLERSLSLGKRSQLETTVRKLSQTLRRDDDTRRAFLEVLSKRGGKDLPAQIAGAMLSRSVPRGLTGSLIGGAGVFSLLNPGSLTSLLPLLAATSPRFIAEFTSLLGKITKPMLESNTLPVQLQREFRQLLIKVIEEESSKKSNDQ